MTLLYLTTGVNDEGYSIAIDKCFDAFNEFFAMPTKGALTQIRDRISHLFFKDQFENIKNEFSTVRSTYKGFYIYSIDGDIYSLPRTDKIEAEDFYGCPVANNKESHFLRMYTVNAVDVFSGVPLEFAYSNQCKEIDLAISFISRLERNSISIYDRLYFSKKLVREHNKSNSYFLCRLQRSSIREANDLYKCNKRVSKAIIEGVEIRLIKIRNPNSKEDMVFATNLKCHIFSNAEVGRLYIKRWESETSNRDSTSTLKLEQFHSRNMNGILQEIYIHLWFMCFCKMQVAKEHKVDSENMLNDEYKKSNIKEVISFVVLNIPKLIIKGCGYTYEKLKMIVNKSVENRKHNNRSNPRVTKSLRREYRGAYSREASWKLISPCPERAINKVLRINHCG